MADTKATGLAEYVGPPADNDMLYMVDVSDTTMAASGTSKKNQGKNYLRTNGTANTLGANIAANGYNFTGAGIVNAGSVGLGTATPGGRLHILQPTSGSPSVLVDNGVKPFSVIGGGTVSTGIGWRSYIIGTNFTLPADNIPQVDGTTGYVKGYAIGMSIEDSTDRGMTFWTGTGAGSDMTQRMVINNAGSVGIGTATPSYRLDVNGSFQSTSVGGTWTGLSFGSGWESFGSGFQAGQYKKVGDLVFLRGLVKRSSGVGTTIATLPSGFRPPANTVFITNATDAFGRVDVQTDGVVLLNNGSASYVQLDGIVFSTL